MYLGLQHASNEYCYRAYYLGVDRCVMFTHFLSNPAIDQAMYLHSEVYKKSVATTVLAKHIARLDPHWNIPAFWMFLKVFFNRLNALNIQLLPLGTSL